MDKNFKNLIITLLLKDDRLKDEQGELKGNLVKEFVNTLDENLITILLEDEKTRAQFFLKIKDAYVFKTNAFKFFLDENRIDNSFTQYSNQIGLSSGGKFLKDNTDVVLNFPFKDCVLEGGQSTEDGLDTYFEDDGNGDYTEKQSKRKEIFFNEVLAKDEIDRLLEPKAFTNITKYDSKGKSTPTKFNRNTKGTITDNLIIKGNNLLALHSLKQEFKGKVKLIYIDPPYNTGNDSFAYNDNFNHSTWLTFMRNRIEVAKDLLREDGVIFIQCDDSEESYLKIIMDDLFSRDCFMSKITWQRTPEGRTALGQGSAFINNSSEYILCYCKNSIKKPTESNILKSIDATEKALNQYSYKLTKEGNRELESVIEDSRGNKISLFRHNEYNFEKIKSNVSIEDRLKHFEHLTRPAAQQKESSLQQKILTNIDKSCLYSVEYIPTSGKSKGVLKKSFYFNNNILLFLKDYSNTDGKRVLRNAAMNDFWSHDEIQVTGISEEGGVTLKRGKKPEKLIQRIVQMSTVENDIVLDYHFGSGTTGAVAHKMNRQYIGLEQLDYAENDSVQRLKNVIDADLSGISKSVNWQGGGSFTYLELAKNNQTAKEEILKCNSYNELMQYFETMYKQYFLHYNVRIKEFKEVISQEVNFKNLALDRQKEIFSKMLDLNQLYVNISEMEDSRYKLDAKDITLSKDFYQVKK
jgi:adenine-specific DNA-methyltransferase